MMTIMILVLSLLVLCYRADDDYFQKIYEASYARMGPYIVGLITGYLLYRFKCKCRIPLVSFFIYYFDVI